MIYLNIKIPDEFYGKKPSNNFFFFNYNNGNWDFVLNKNKAERNFKLSQLRNEIIMDEETFMSDFNKN